MTHMKIALGSARAAKIMAVRSGIARIATIDAAWDKAELVARTVETNAPAMPLTDSQLMRGARLRAEAVRELLLSEGQSAHFYVGLEGGFHSITLDGERHTLLRGWAYVTDGARTSFGAAPSISVPGKIVRRVFESRCELGDIIDELAGAVDVRSRQGAWGILSRDLLTRAQSFETAIVAAFAPFYNEALYHDS
ncbi:MAG TPA: inosine/xanthosine triphosphatase [Pyrinomonadaceae bacterium]|nr:inosine/xanthosine triphosphatase [Pyrinomonadaceae bacterium]